MRNIAILEWGPSSLYHVEPRELIRVRPGSGFRDDGPMMPNFLASKEEQKDTKQQIKVRYVYSAHQNLDKAVRNLRKCFGFPYPDAVGYVNALTRAYRVRREHEPVIERLKQWAIFGNVDAIIWIDYEKSNQKPGEFKRGSRPSIPFGPKHLLLSLHDTAFFHNEDEEEDEMAVDETAEAWSPRETSINLTVDERTPRSGRAGTRGRSTELIAMIQKTRQRVPNRRAQSSPSKDQDDPSTSLQQTQQQTKVAVLSDPLEDILLIQPEVIPPFGSIYPRKITPGPGQYGLTTHLEIGGTGPKFGIRAKLRGQIDEVLRIKKMVPGPGYNDLEKGLASTLPRHARQVFTKAAAHILPVDGDNRLPFISEEHSLRENITIHSPPGFHDIPLDTRNDPRSAATPRHMYTFSKAERM